MTLPICLAYCAVFEFPFNYFSFFLLAPSSPVHNRRMLNSVVSARHSPSPNQGVGNRLMGGVGGHPMDLQDENERGTMSPSTNSPCHSPASLKCILILNQINTISVSMQISHHHLHHPHMTPPPPPPLPVVHPVHVPSPLPHHNIFVVLYNFIPQRPDELDLK
jgi:hypothetical protein